MTRAAAIVASLVLVGATLTAPCAVAGEDTFVLRLTGFREVPKTLSVDGSGTAKLTVQGSAILYQLTYQALGSAVTAAHIHLGENATAGGIAAFLCGGRSKPVCPSPGGSVSGIVAASDVLALPDQGLPAGAIGELIGRSGQALFTSTCIPPSSRPANRAATLGAGSRISPGASLTNG